MTALQKIRLDRKLTRAQLAAKSGVSYGSIRRHEIGEGQLGDGNLFKLADVLKCQPSELVDLEPAKGEAA